MQVVAGLRGGWAEPRPARPDGTQPLGEAGPGPGLDLLVPERGLRPGRLEILEPGVGLLDCQCLVSRQQLLGAHAREG